MRKTLLPLSIFVLLALLTGCSSYHAQDRFIAPDKLLHFTVAATIGACVTVAANGNGASNGDAPRIGISVATVLGAGKEVYDATARNSYFSWKDLFWDIAGGCAGSYVMKK